MLSCLYFFKPSGRFLVIATLVCVNLIISGCGIPESAEKPTLPQLEKFNIIMISLDTLRRDHLGSYGCPDPVSPFLDRIAQRAVICEDVASQSASTWTSHRSLFTGKYIAHSESGDPTPESTLAGQLQTQGYTTAAFVDGGKMHRQYGHAVGFQQYDDSGGHLERIIPQAKTWLRNHQNNPFFLFLHTYDIHAPYNPLQHDDQVFMDITDLPEIYRTEAPLYLNTLNLDRVELEKLANLYKGGVRSCDRQLTDLFNFLQNEGYLETTLVVLISDHGESLGERMHLGHHEMYYAQLAVPMILFIPDFPSRVVQGTVENLDVMPTLLDLVGLSIPQEIQGISLRQSIINGHVNRPDRFHHAEHKRRTIFRDLSWKLILGKDSSDDELYNLSSDPAEEMNLIRSESAQMEWLQNQISESLNLPMNAIRKFNENRKNLPLNIVPETEDDILRQQLETLGYLEKNR